MRQTIEAESAGYPLYRIRREEYTTPNKVPFRVSPTPFEVTKEQSQELGNIGRDIADYIDIIDELYRTQAGIRNLLDRGKPEIFTSEHDSQYLFYRPDIIITPSGFSIVEVETSPFGLALASILNSAYRKEGFNTLVDEDALSSHMRKTLPVEGTLLYTHKTAAYAGQLSFLADRIISGEDHRWSAQHLGQNPSNGGVIYRGFYLSEYLSDPGVKALLEAREYSEEKIFPSLTPHLEEKTILSLLWDKRWEGYIRKQLGDTAFAHLRGVIPPSWIVGEEEFFSPGLPNGISSSVDLATISKSKRAFVLKSSGFRDGSSWSEGVHFLHKTSSDSAANTLRAAATDPTGLHIVQTFNQGVKIPIQYQGLEGNDGTMMARVRLTPYVSATTGAMVAMKATGCENTDYIHASTASINTAVMEKPTVLF